MDAQSIIDLIAGMLWSCFWISLPLLAVGLVAGVIISLLQIVTSIQDSSFSAVPRLTAFLAVLLVAMPWMLTRLITYTSALFGDLGRFAH